METLKQFDELTEPDQRNFYFCLVKGKEVARRMTLKDVHEQVSSITLHQNVPEDIKSHFAQAQNLAVYSWFHYQLNVTAQLMAFVSVEYALKKKTGTKCSFKSLIERAIAEGWIADEGFAMTELRDNQEESYVSVLSDVMPKLRNDLAHGTGMLHNNALSSLQICADFINQLFPRCEQAGGVSR